MTANKKLISTICIIALILAITVGALLSVGAQSSNTGYSGENFSNLVSTGAEIKAGTLTTSKAEEELSGTAISSADELIAFINGNDAYGYLTDHITLDWSGVGSAGVILAEGRTIDGNGKTVTLQDTQASSEVVNNGYGDSLGYGGQIGNEQEGRKGGINYGMFVDYNAGTIKNIKFVYNSTVVLADNGTIQRQYAGIVCGTNAGTISNCDLTVSGTFTYNYNKTSQINDSNFNDERRTKLGWTLMFGGIAGRNAGTISNINADYNGFTCNLTCKSNNKKRAHAQISSGGIAGTMYSNKSVIKNIIIKGRNTTFNLSTTKSNDSGVNTRAQEFRFSAAVVGSNSAYSRAEGGIATNISTQGTIDNIISDCSTVNWGEVGQSGNSFTDQGWKAETTKSINAVVHCGQATNVTILAVTNRYAQSQNLDYQTDNCGCNPDTNAGSNEEQNHVIGYGNLIDISNDKYSDVTVGFDEANNQVITATLNNAQEAILGEVVFAKYAKRSSDGSASQVQTPLNDPAGYGSEVPVSGSTYLYANETDRVEYAFKIPAYQTSPDCFWEYQPYSYRYAEIGENSSAEGWATQYTYTGKDFLTTQLSFASKVDNITGTVNPNGFRAVSTESTEDEEIIVASGRLPGTYSFTLEEYAAGFSYVDTDKKVVVKTEETTGVEYSFTVIKAAMRIKNYPNLSDLTVWTNQNRTLELEVVNGIEKAFDGYHYVANASSYDATGTSWVHNTTTPKAGRTFTSVYLTSGGVQVTNTIEFTIKIDKQAPTVEYEFEHDGETWWAHNRISIDAQDAHSEVESIKLYSYNSSSNSYEIEQNDIIGYCTNPPSTDEKSKVEDGKYYYYFETSGNKKVVVTDYAGNEVEVVAEVKVDKVKPIVSIYAYYMKDVPRTDEEGGFVTDENDQQIYDEVETEYTSETNTEGKAVYFQASATTYGSSGYVIQYSTNSGNTWINFPENGLLVVKKKEEHMRFRIRSKAYTHSSASVAPYSDKYYVNNYWSGNIVEGVLKDFFVNVTLDPVTITSDDVIVTTDGGDVTKVFDGTTNFVGEIRATDKFLADNKITQEQLIFTAVYADAEVGEGIDLIITVELNNDTKALNTDKIEGKTGAITKKAITIVVDKKDKYYGYDLPELTATATGMLTGWEEDINSLLEVDTRGCEDVRDLPRSKGDDDVNGYTIRVKANAALKNYEITGVTTGILEVWLAPIDRLVYTKGAFTGLTTENIAKRNLKISFTRANGKQEQLVVKFYGAEQVLDELSGQYVTEYTKPIADIKTAGSGFFKVVISLPDKDDLENKYYISETVGEFMIKVINSAMFPVVKDDENKTQDDAAKVDEAAQTAPVVNNSAQPSDYEGSNKTSTDNTDTEIAPAAKNTRDYLAMVSIFCAVAMLIAFAIGVGRAIMKRARR